MKVSRLSNVRWFFAETPKSAKNAKKLRDQVFSAQPFRHEPFRSHLILQRHISGQVLFDKDLFGANSVPFDS